jgi:multiple sugar transport system permease protein
MSPVPGSAITARPYASLHDRRLVWRRVVLRALLYALILIGAVVEFVPIAWMISTSLKDEASIAEFPPAWIPEVIHWENYVEIFIMLPFLTFIVNTVVIVVASVLGQVISSSLVAFAFARLRFRGSRVLFVLFLMSLMIPYHVTIIPQYILFRTIGWVNTYYPLILPNCFASAYFVFLLRQFFTTIPREMDDAARIDGSGTLGIYWRLIMPLSAPALAVVAIYEFLQTWNDFFRPLIFLHSSDLFTIALGLRFLQQFEGGFSPWHLLMAASLVTTLPVVVLFFSLQRMFIQGVVISGVKG